MKKKIVLIVSIVLAALITLSVFVFAAYDGSKDPLVSLSYLTKYVNEAIKPLGERLEELTNKGTEPAESFTAIELKPGQMIQCTAATELILRSGTAVIVSPYEGQGLCDMTEGVDLDAGVEVPKNHCLLIPRGNDGRGIKITGTVNAFVMVGGAYKIVG